MATNLQPARGVRFHDLTEVAHKLGERVPDLAVLKDERLWVSIAPLLVSWSFLVCPVLSSASHGK